MKPSQVIAVTQSGTYTLFPNDDINSGGGISDKVLALTIPYGSSSGGALYFIEYQHRIWSKSNSRWISGGGLILRMGYGEYRAGNSTHLIDIVPSTETQMDAPIYILENRIMKTDVP